MGTNSGAEELPFQEWRHFKEAFTPELIARAVRESPIPVRRCIDPFGGSGTTALACQFLGVAPVTIEVNPYLADLIEAKLAAYDSDDLARDLGRVLRSAVRRRTRARLTLPDGAPPTLVQPGKDGRWVFDRSIARRLGAILDAVDLLEDSRHRRLLRVLLGGILLNVSNVVVNGKGRRYRRRWEERRRSPQSVELLFGSAVRRAVTDIHQFSDRPHKGFEVIRGDARNSLRSIAPCDLAVFSPPYPNSFDYTDVYNLELWVLGYLRERNSNRALRQSTLSSHVQIDRAYSDPPVGSPTLERVTRRLGRARDRLWNARIPEMVGAYFADLMKVLLGLRAILRPRATIWLVVGDSQYADVLVPTAKILQELAPTRGLVPLTVEPFRSMRSSAQQGGRPALSETLLVLNRQ
jgi:DNA modification methylase